MPGEGEGEIDRHDGAAAAALRPLGALLAPSSVAVVGASERRADLLRTAGSGPATTWYVNPGRREVLGRRCYAAVADLPEVPDVALVVVGQAGVEAACTEALDAGVGGLVVPGLGAESGAEGSAVARRLGALALERQVPLLGTNCMGFARPGGPSLWIGTPSDAFRPGHVAVLSQSGSVAEALVASGPRVGWRVVVSSGAEVARDAADFTAAFAADEGTRAVGLFLEAVRRPAAFAAALDACAEAGKPVVCLKLGRSARAAAVALTHTGAMVGSALAFSAFLRAHGAVEVDDLPDLVETLEVLGRRRRPASPRAAAISESGGEAGLFADHAERAGLDLPALPPATAAALRAEFPNYLDPHNPLDAWAVDAVERVFPRSLQLLQAGGCGDILVALLELTRFRSPGDQAWCRLVVEALAEVTRGTDVFPAVVSTVTADPGAELAAVAADADVALLRGAGPGARALAAAARWHAARRPGTRRVPGAGAPVAVDDLLRPGQLPEWESAAILARYGIPVAASRRAATPEEAVAAAAALGCPVVVKRDGPAHKSASGGVVLGLATPGDAGRAAADLGGAVLVAAQVPAGAEVLCGVLRDPLFGPVVSAGVGGRVAEAVGPAAVRLAPLDDDAAAEMAAAVPGVPPGGPANQAVVATLLALSRLVTDHPEIDAVDVNPLVLGPAGGVAVDALVVVGSPHHPQPEGAHA